MQILSFITELFYVPAYLMAIHLLDLGIVVQNLLENYQADI